MKITKVDIIKIEPKVEGHMEWGPILCRVYTDTGLFGDGEAAVAYGHGKDGAFGVIKDFSKLIIGMDPLDNEIIWEKLYKATFWGQNGGPIVFSAISALDIALWDIKGKYFNVPIYKLLGGKHRDKLRCYASQLQFGWGEKKTPAHKVEEYVANAKKALSEGYDAIKIDFFTFDEGDKRYNHENQYYRMTPEMEDMVIRRVKAVREAIGDKVDLIMENHSYLDVTTAIRMARKLEKYNIWYFEEPTTPTPQVNKYLNEKINLPIAHGERIYSRWGFLPYFEDNSIALAQLDIGNTGGLTEAKKICDMAHTFDIGVQAHVCASPLSTAVAIHLEANIPNFVIHEHHVYNRLPYNKKLCKFDYQPKNGYLDVIEKPGIGNEISDYCFENGYVETVE